MQIVSLHDCVTTQHVLMLLEKQVPVEISLFMQKTLASTITYI